MLFGEVSWNVCSMLFGENVLICVKCGFLIWCCSIMCLLIYCCCGVRVVKFIDVVSAIRVFLGRIVIGLYVLAVVIMWCMIFVIFGGLLFRCYVRLWSGAHVCIWL